MSKLSGVYFATLVSVSVLLPTMAIAENLSVTVVDDSKHGVSSVIYQGVAADVIIGTTKIDGTLVVPSYKCNYDKPLQAKPIDAAHFNSDQEPCKTPLSFLVHSRMTPTGSIAFNRIWRDVKFPDGSDGQINFKIAMDIDKHSAQISGGPHGLSACKLDYNINGYGSVSQLAADGWKNVSQSKEPVTDIFSFDQKNVDQLFQHGAIRAEKSDKGITVFVPGDCEHTGATTDEFANKIEEAIDQKVKAGQYKSPKDLIRFNESK
jgi:hypothetical protein